MFLYKSIFVSEGLNDDDDDDDGVEDDADYSDARPQPRSPCSSWSSYHIRDKSLFFSLCMT